MRRRLLSVVLAVAAALTVCPVISSAGSSPEIEIIERITIEIPNYQGVELTLTNVANECRYEQSARMTEGFQGVYTAIYVYYSRDSTMSLNQHMDTGGTDRRNPHIRFITESFPFSEYIRRTYEDERYEPGIALTISDFVNYSDSSDVDDNTLSLQPMITDIELDLYSEGGGNPLRTVIYFIPTQYLQETNALLTRFAVSTVSDEEELIDAGVLLEGAHPSLVEELAQALEIGFIPESMIGNWTEHTSRLLAAEMIVILVESITGKDVDEIAEEKGFDMTGRFSDTDRKAVTFLKAAGISNGVDGVRYDPDGKFTRVMMVTMLGRLAENVLDIDLSGYQQGTDVFTDLPVAVYAYANQYVGWAAQTGITLGSGAQHIFYPGGDLLNEATGAFTLRAYKYFAE